MGAVPAGRGEHAHSGRQEISFCWNHPERVAPALALCERRLPNLEDRLDLAGRATRQRVDADGRRGCYPQKSGVMLGAWIPPFMGWLTVPAEPIMWLRSGSSGAWEVGTRLFFMGDGL